MLTKRGRNIYVSFVFSRFLDLGLKEPIMNRGGAKRNDAYIKREHQRGVYLKLDLNLIVFTSLLLIKSYLV